MKIAPQPNAVLSAIDIETASGSALNERMAACFPGHKVMDLTAATRNYPTEMSPSDVGAHA